MIKYNNNTIYDWNFDTSNVIKVYRNNAIVFYKFSGESPTPEWKVCFAVVDDISQYTDREFEDVYDNATDKWYKLNNLNQYEEYGVYGQGTSSTVTTYKGKLTIDDGYEYEWNGSSWVNLGEVTGSTATLPNVPFTVNYNAKNYDASTHTFTKTNEQLADTDVTITSGTLTAHDGYVTVASGSRGIISGYDNYFNRTNSAPNLTIISKQRTEGSNCHMFANRTSNYNWMYRPYYNRLTLHGTSEQGQLAVTTQPVIESVRVDSNRDVTYNNYTDNTSSTQSSFSYGSTNGSVALFAGYTSTSGEWFVGDFYWIYMSQTTLTDEQVQEVINYNEGNSSSEYPKYYSEKSDPLNNLTFDTMAEAKTYAYNNCVYDGMRAIIDGNRYYFDSSDENGWVEIIISFTVDLNSQWQTSTSYGDIADVANYEFYQSFSNYNVDSGKATMFITINGYTSFTFKVRNYSESNYDYVVVNNIDDTSIPRWHSSAGSGTASDGKVYYTNRYNSSDTTWYDVTFNNLDGGEHIITVTYGKDGSSSSNDDRGYVAIPKTQ